jgi:hypothetical protein
VPEATTKASPNQSLVPVLSFAAMRLLMLASLLPAAMAAFDQCARASGTWVGFDQVRDPALHLRHVTCPSLCSANATMRQLRS